MFKGAYIHSQVLKARCA